jgi:hypothetical protein
MDEGRQQKRLAGYSYMTEQRTERKLTGIRKQEELTMTQAIRQSVIQTAEAENYSDAGTPCETNG